MDPRHHLDEAVHHLIRHFNKLSDDIEFEENRYRSRLKRHHPLHLDSTGIKAFSILEGQVTLHCLQLLKSPWSKACSESNLDTNTDIDINLPCNHCPEVLQYYLPCHHYLRPFAVLKEPIPLHLIHPRWHIDRNRWDPTGKWQIPINPLDDSPPQASTIQFTHIPDHRGQQKFVEAAYEMEAYLEQQPAILLPTGRNNSRKLLLRCVRNGSNRRNLRQLFFLHLQSASVLSSVLQLKRPVQLI